MAKLGFRHRIPADCHRSTVHADSIDSAPAVIPKEAIAKVTVDLGPIEPDE
jgi:hypothetical protein